MRIERLAIERELSRAGLSAVRVIQTGIGKQAILRTLEAQAAAGDSIILAGTCGALRPVEDVPIIARIIDTSGGEWPCRFRPRPESPNAAHTLVAVDHIVSAPADKAELARRTGAAVVDMESHVFAAACEARGARWHVVRGVSDTPDQTLPDEVLGWITPEGNTRAGRAALDLASRPRLIPHIAAVIRRSNRVLPLVGKEVVATIRAWRTTPHATTDRP